MTRTLQLESRADRISFELERFDSPAGDRLEVSGRWFGVRGRRFVRPTMTLFTDEGAFRALADLEHKPWEPEEGGRWEAAFPWEGGAEVLEAELAVAPNVTIALPPPGAARKGRAGVPGRVDEPAPTAKRSGARSSRRNELDALRDELSASRRETERLRHQIDALREQADAARVSHGEDASALEAAKRETNAAATRRDAALADLDRANAARELALLELETAKASRDAALAGRDQALAERDQALAERDQALAERDQAVAERDQSFLELGQERQWRELAARDQDAAQRASAEYTARLDQGQLALERALGQRDQLQQALEQALRERDDAISSRGAALVMRNAARASIGPDHHAGWLQRTVAIVVLVCGVFALLIVLHLL
jgi:hypothetical protein